MPPSTWKKTQRSRSACILNNLKTFFSALLFLWILACAAAGGYAGTLPINIDADSMTYSPSGNEVVFRGNVVVKRTDFTLRASTIKIYMQKKKKQNPSPDKNLAPFDPGGIQKIIASGGVRMDYQGKVGTCGAATYFVNQGLLQMEGNPKLQDGKNTIKGAIIKFHLNDNRSEVIGGKSQRVRATFQAPDKIKAPQ